MQTNVHTMKKYETVQTFLRSKIESGLIVPGEKLPSESELMAQFGVSRNAVRQAINELIKERLVESQQGIGTFCVKRTQGGSMLIGMVSFRISSYIFPRLVSACNQTVQREGYTLLLNETWYDAAQERSVLLNLRKRGVDGIVITPVQEEGRGATPIYSMSSRPREYPWSCSTRSIRVTISRAS